ncbi:MAG: hypothetical protein ACHREM_28895, partial [Polyangiales bacterium]
MFNPIAWLFERFWWRTRLAELRVHLPVDALRGDLVRAERLGSYARAASQVAESAEDARVAYALYAQAFNEARRSLDVAPLVDLPSASQLQEARDAADRRRVIEACNAAYERARGDVLQALAPYHAIVLRRVARVAIVVTVLGLVVLDVKRVVRPELAEGKPWRLSSVSGGFPISGGHFMT